MFRKYTAEQEIREMANGIKAYLALAETDDVNRLIAMLRKAAEMMDKVPSIIESRLGRAEKRQKHDIANELFDCLHWTSRGKPEAFYANPEKLGKLWARLRRESDEIESEWEEPAE